MTVPLEKADAFAALLKSAVRFSGEELEYWESIPGIGRLIGPNGIPEPPGMALKRLRRAKKMTQRQTADLIGVQQSRISDMEAGTKRIPPDIAKVFADHFGVSVDTFLVRNKK